MLDPTSDDFWKENLMVHDWPESGPDSISLEALYQAFKVRMLIEAAQEGADKREGKQA